MNFKAVMSSAFPLTEPRKVTCSRFGKVVRPHGGRLTAIDRSREHATGQQRRERVRVKLKEEPHRERRYHDNAQTPPPMK